MFIHAFIRAQNGGVGLVCALLSLVDHNLSFAHAV